MSGKAVANCNTENHIKNVAKQLFFAEGKLNATTQEIADAAGVNRTLLNYYFRSRDALFKIVFQEALEELKNRVDTLITSECDIIDKLVQLVDTIINETMSYPYREVFVITWINQEGTLEDPLHPDNRPNVWKPFMDEIEQAMAENKLPKMKPVDFILNIYSMAIYPILMKPIYAKMLQVTDESLNDTILNRKQAILSFIINK